jgi:hypothetical protein
MITALLLGVAFLGFLMGLLGLVTLGFILIASYVIKGVVLASETKMKAELDSRLFTICEQWKSELATLKAIQAPSGTNPFYMAQDADPSKRTIVSQEDADLIKRSLIAHADATHVEYGQSAGAGGV